MKFDLEAQLSQVPAMKTVDLRELWGKLFGNGVLRRPLPCHGILGKF